MNTARFWWFWYCTIAYGWRERPFVWCVGPHPRWLNRLCGWLYNNARKAEDNSND